MSSRWPGVCVLNVAWRGPWWFHVKVPKKYVHNGSSVTYVIVDEMGGMIIPPMVKSRPGDHGGLVLSVLIWHPGVYRLGVYEP